MNRYETDVNTIDGMEYPDFIVVAGNILAGFEFYGPFFTRHQAERWAYDSLKETGASYDIICITVPSNDKFGVPTCFWERGICKKEAGK